MSDSTPKKEAKSAKSGDLTQRDLEILSKAWGAMKTAPEVSYSLKTFANAQFLFQHVVLRSPDTAITLRLCLDSSAFIMQTSSNIRLTD